MAANLATLEPLFFKVASGENLTLDEIGEASTIPKDEFDRQVTRVRGVLEARKAYGTAEQREAAKQRLAEAEAASRTQSVELQNLIEESHRQFKELESNVRLARAKVAAHEQALAKLRNSIPQHVDLYHKAAANLFHCQPRFDRMRKLESRVRQLPRVMAFDMKTLEGQEQARGHAEHNQPSLIVETEVTRTACGSIKSRKVDHHKWGEYIARLSKELPEAEQELATLQSEYEAGQREIDKVLDFYIAS